MIDECVSWTKKNGLSGRLTSQGVRRQMIDNTQRQCLAVKLGVVWLTTDESRLQLAMGLIVNCFVEPTICSSAGLLG